MNRLSLCALCVAAITLITSCALNKQASTNGNTNQSAQTGTKKSPAKPDATQPASSVPVGELQPGQASGTYKAKGEVVELKYGWFLRTNAQGQVAQVSHSGSDGVFLAVFVWRPLDQVFFYFVTNNRDRGGAETASAILRILRDSSKVR